MVFAVFVSACGGSTGDSEADSAGDSASPAAVGEDGGEQEPGGRGRGASNWVQDTVIHKPEETHFANVRQLTFGGQNAEAYWAFDGSHLIYQSTPPEGGCDQIFTLDLASGVSERVSTGEGRTTCSYFYPSGDQILYSSTHQWGAACPAEPDLSEGYVWAVYPTFDVFVSDSDGSNLRPLTRSWGYDAEATFSPRGDRIVFTSMRDGDLDIYSMAPDGSDVVRLTDQLGYDGGPFYSPDGSKIVYRAHRPETPEAAADYRSLLAEGMIRPSALEIYVMDADGSNQTRLTENGAANFAPYWHPSGQQIVFSSNLADPAGRDFDIFMIQADGSGIEQITHSGEFDGFPVFSPDGTQIVFASNRNGSIEGDTNIFIADWVPRETP
jgi:Tol biopolymer transport system component